MLGGLPTKFDQDIEAISTLANSIIAKLGIMKRASFRSTPNGNVMIKKMPSDVELRMLREQLQMFADAVLELAHSDE